MANSIVTQIGKSTVEYDLDTGWFVWVCAYRKPFLVGHRAERATSNGYLYIKAAGQKHSASRLAWTLTNGEIPKGLEIDHINRDKQDNRISNLRVVTRKENLRNRAFAPNRCGFVGVSKHKQSGLYRARLEGVTKYAKTVEEAAALYAKLIEDRL
jgi:hypothetical protein